MNANRPKNAGPSASKLSFFAKLKQMVLSATDGPGGELAVQTGHEALTEGLNAVHNDDHHNTEHNDASEHHH